MYTHTYMYIYTYVHIHLAAVLPYLKHFNKYVIKREEQ